MLFCLIDENAISLGGINRIVEADETVISRRGIIRSPTSLDDSVLDTIWILGAVDKEDVFNFFIKRIRNRQIDTISETLEGIY